MAAGVLDEAPRALLDELAPVARRALALDPDALARLRMRPAAASILARLPFNVLVARTVASGNDAAVPPGPVELAADITVRADEFIAWLDAERSESPQTHDEQWRAGLPPDAGWRRIETVPDDVIRSVVRQGALALKDATQGSLTGSLPGTPPSQAVADALLDSVVLTVNNPDTPGLSAEVNLRTLSALTRMGFLPRDSHAHVDIAGRWIRVVAAYGTVYAEAAGLSLTLV